MVGKGVSWLSHLAVPISSSSEGAHLSHTHMGSSLLIITLNQLIGGFNYIHNLYTVPQAVSSVSLHPHTYTHLE